LWVLKKFIYLCHPVLDDYIQYIRMRKDIHPENYRQVVFKDMSNEYSFVCNSCAETSETIQWEDGNDYPLIKLDISHKSHPFFTGIVQFVDTAGRIDKFNTRYGSRKKK
jgi:large subunit ribosomal protein L31